ncbi:MAG: universal stress protein [Pseudomonadota bacterium]
MTWKTILVPFVEEETARAGFAAAAVFAKKFNAHIVALHLRQRPMPTQAVYFPLGGAFPPDDDDAFKQAEDAHAAQLHQLFDDLCDEHKVGIVAMEKHKSSMDATASWRDEKGDLPTAYAKAGAGFDLIATMKPTTRDAYFQSRLVEELLFRSGRPVLLCPKMGMPSFPARAALAWNGSAEAASAVSAASPVLSAAETVRILSVSESPEQEASIDDLSTGLRLQGVNAAASEIGLEKGVDAQDALMKRFAGAEVDLVIMGAYSHSRWRQAMLGGLTRAMIYESETPVLMKR